MSRKDDVRQVRTLSEIVQIPLIGQEGSIVGAVLAELVSKWLVHIAEPDREEALNQFVELVRKLMPLNDKILAQKQREGAVTH